MDGASQPLLQSFLPLGSQLCPEVCDCHLDSVGALEMDLVLNISKDEILSFFLILFSFKMTVPMNILMFSFSKTVDCCTSV